jgi:hypothetical protein
MFCDCKTTGMGFFATASFMEGCGPPRVGRAVPAVSPFSKGAGGQRILADACVPIGVSAGAGVERPDTTASEAAMGRAVPGEVAVDVFGLGGIRNGRPLGPTAYCGTAPGLGAAALASATSGWPVRRSMYWTT